jgi:hypothetical protein
MVSNSANLTGYNYAIITDVISYSGSAALMDMEVKVYDALSATRLQVIGNGQVGQLSDTQRQQLLIVRFFASQNNEESVVGINFVDYMTGKPIASCKGAYSSGSTKEKEMITAIDNAIAQIKASFK